MADDGVHVAADDDSKIVTEFFLTTCLQQPSEQCVWAAAACSMIASKHAMSNVYTEQIPLITGSTAELYIRPMLSCVSDLDIMVHYSSKLAIPANCLPPTRLPDEFHRRVMVHEMIDSEFPGYVFLKLRYVLTEYTDDGNYHAEHVYGQPYVCITPYNKAECHGPAEILQPVEDSIICTIDKVFCVRSLVATTSRRMATATQKLRLARHSNCCSCCHQWV